MTFRYLDKDGAISFWTNIKNYILSKIPTKTSEIQNDSGYITNTDTCLHKSGGETFTGYKTVENINSGLIFKSTDYQAEIRLSGSEPYDVSIVSHKLSNNTYSYCTLMDRYGNVFPDIYRPRQSSLTVYVSNTVSSNSGNDGLSVSTPFSVSEFRRFLNAIRMQSSNNLGATYGLTVNLIPTGTSYGTCGFDSTKMPYVKNLIIQTSTGIEGTPENYTTNCPDLLQLYISGNMDVTVRNIKCGEIGVYQGAKVTLTNFNAVGQVRADNNGYVIVGGYLYVFYFPWSTAPRASLFEANLDGHIRIESTDTTINFSEQIYYTAGVLRVVNHGYLYANISRWKLLGIKPCVIASSSTTVLTTCSTPGNVSAKTVETGTTIGTSSVIGVTFSETNTADNPTLNVNGLGDWSIVADNNAVDIKHYLPFGVRIIFKRFGNTWKITNTKDLFQYIAGDCSMYVSGTLGTTYNNGEFNFGDYIVSQSTSSTNTGIYNAVQYNINGTNIFDGSRTITQPWVYTATPSIKLTTTLGGTSYQDKGIKFKDTNNADVGYLYGSTFASGSSVVGISAYNVIDNATVSKSVRIILQNDGTSYFCPGNPNDISLGSEYFAWKNVYANKYYLGSTEFGDIVTHNASEFITQHQSLANYVTTNTNQSISGIKTFPTNIDLANTNTSLREYWPLKLSKTDTNGTGASQLGVFQPANSSDFVACLRLGNPRGDNKPTTGTGINTGNCWSGIGVYYNYALNRGYPYAPSCTSWNDSSNADAELASTAWVRRYCETTKGFLTSHQSLANYVTTDTDQSITGTKTFGNGTLIVDNGTGSNVHGEIKLDGTRPGYIVADNASDGVFDNVGCGVSILLQDAGKPLHIGAYKTDSNGRVFVDNTNKNPVLSITSSLVKTSTLVPENDTVNSTFRILSQLDYANGNSSKLLDVRFVQHDNANATSAIYSNDDNKTSLGLSSKRWSSVYATNAYITNLNLNGNAFDPTSVSGNIGDIVFASAYYSSITGTASLDLTVSGNDLYLAGFDNDTLVISSQVSLTGTWKFLGGGKPTTTSGNADTKRVGLWKRIA